ncbi:MAG: 4Fe-4S binding protein [Bacillota bacterium]
MAIRISDECVACGSCMDACPEGAISEGDIFAIDPAKCSECKTCVETCPIGAIIEE